MSVFAIRLEQLAHRLAEHGPAAVETELAELAAEAAGYDLAPVLLAVLCDSHEPDVVRQRAFAKIVARVSRLRHDTSGGCESISRDEHESHYQISRP